MSEGGARDVVIVGGGLVGSLLATLLADRGFGVTVYERFPDVRDAQAAGGRSINLVVTSRGLHALRQAGLENDVLGLTVPVTGRMIHSLGGTRSYQPYGRNPSECNHSVSRKDLNAFLVSRAEARGVQFRFGHTLSSADTDTGRLRFEGPAGDAVEVEAPVVFGADGAGSVLRTEMMRRAGAEESVELLEHGYKELEIPLEQASRIERNVLHVWPRGHNMLMALPNLDGSFTVTLYLPHRGPLSFESLDNATRLLELFEEQFPDAIELIPGVVDSFFGNPTGELGTVRCRPWHVRGRAALIGDAAHAIVPFFGQGMNCGFEDCTVLFELLEAHPDGDWETIFREYDAARKPHTDAIAEMALENFVEMRDRVGDPRFLLLKEVEHRLEQKLPRDYRSRYSMVMYSQIPYRIAQEAGELQREILEELCRGLQVAADVDLGEATRLVKAKLTPFLQARSVELDY